MSTLNKIIYNIRNIIKERNDDTQISNSQLEFIFSNWRNRLITQNYRKARYSDTVLTQPLGVVEMEQVDSAEDCNLQSGCKILRSKLKLPVPIEIDEKPLFTFIGSIDQTGPQYQMIPWSRFTWIKHQKYTGHIPYVAYKDGYIYMINKKVLDAIAVHGIFENPKDAAKFNNCDGKPCYTDDDRYPVDSGMIPLITQLMFDNELAQYKKSIEDKTNNNDDDTARAR